MKVIAEISALRALRKNWQLKDARIALVPTMGNLHAGHLALVEQAKSLAEHVIVSIFVNPTQFGPKEDFANYPRTLDADLEKLQALNVDAVFVPTAEEVYPQGLNTVCHVEVSGIANELCGKTRPGHFSAVATVVAKLFNLVQPDIAIFGQKDLQQVTVIRQMVADLNFPLEIIMAPTVRELDGLAMSSRNQYLTAEERKIAPKIYAVLSAVRAEIQSERRDYAQLEIWASAQLNAAGFKVDYVAIRRKTGLGTPIDGEEVAVLAAAYLGKARLIDNV